MRNKRKNAFKHPFKGKFFVINELYLQFKTNNYL